MTSESPGLERSLSLCCQPGGNVVKTLITVNRRDSQRERERNRSVEVTAPHSSHAQQAGSSVSHESPDTSLVSFVNSGPSLARSKRHESMFYDSDRL